MAYNNLGTSWGATIFFTWVIQGTIISVSIEVCPMRDRFNGALFTVYLYMLYPIATFQKAGTCIDDHQSMAKQQHGETANQKLCE